MRDEAVADEVAIGPEVVSTSSLRQDLGPDFESFNELDLDLFLRWMQGGRLLASPDEEPYQVVLAGVRDAFDKKTLRILLGRLAAETIQAYLADTSIRSGLVDIPEQVLFNVLHLCAGLESRDLCGDVLWQALLGLYNAVARGKELGSWRNRSLQRALVSALIRNQRGPELSNEWMSVLQGKPGVLPMRVNEAFDGILRMPPSLGETHRPAMDAIVEALLHISRTCEANRASFTSYLDDAGRFWQRYAKWDLELLEKAMSAGWPRWAVWRLRGDITIRISQAPERWYVWRFVRESIPEEFHVKVIHKFDEFAVDLVEVEVYDDASLYLRCFSPLFETYRRERAERYQADNSMRAVLHHMLKAFSENNLATQKDVEIFWKSRVQILQCLRNVEDASSPASREDDAIVISNVENIQVQPRNATEIGQLLAEAVN